MSGYGIFAIGCVFGCLVGLLGAGMLAAAYRGEVEREKVEAYCQGVKDGQAAERRWAREGARSGDGGDILITTWETMPRIRR